MPNDMMSGGITAEDRPPLADDRILHNGQYVAMVVAETPEQARYAASLVKVDYKSDQFAVAIEDAEATKFKPHDFNGQPLTLERGNWKKEFEKAEVRLD